MRMRGPSAPVPRVPEVVVVVRVTAAAVGVRVVGVRGRASRAAPAHRATVLARRVVPEEAEVRLGPVVRVVVRIPAKVTRLK